MLLAQKSKLSPEFVFPNKKFSQHCFIVAGQAIDVGAAGGQLGALVLADLQGDWKVFVHFESPGRRRTVHDHQPVGELYAMKKWKKGE